ncbi:isochorismatase family protein [Methylobacterium oryzihabitans]|uniref:Isochorismatase family protein n=1 Tax=Methylobacterium oryzihabitans TaxID=2499852 RepID=A0A437PBZ7_9HYPH|nr:isochorismatase family protein [Methylobacterium oryzihabitans]RVU19784.1 isochorismatase family protein [Methylobacterium oryzihabitans]
MPLLSRTRSALLVVDLQARLVPAIADGAAVVAQAGRLMRAAERLGVPVLLTEQNPKGLGATVPQLEAGSHPVLEKRAFSATRAEGFLACLPDRPDVVVAGCEAHVCVLQTVAGLIEAGRRVFVVEDAVGSRAPASRAAALRRMTAHGAEIVTVEMVVFEWLESAADPLFKDVVALVK